jgi:outer membrane murein-binding lipoprotein Lpp
VFLLAFFLLVAAAVYASPLVCGSANEAKIIRSPQELDGNKIEL